MARSWAARQISHAREIALHARARTCSFHRSLGDCRLPVTPGFPAFAVVNYAHGHAAPLIVGSWAVAVSVKSITFCAKIAEWQL